VKPFKVSYVYPSVVRTESSISITIYGENFVEPLNLLLGHYSIDCAIRSISVAVCERSALISISQGELFAELVSAFHSENIAYASAEALELDRKMRQDEVARCQKWGVVGCLHQLRLYGASSGLRGLVRSCQNGFYRLVL